jgi:hypothetical protein
MWQSIGVSLAHELVEPRAIDRLIFVGSGNLKHFHFDDVAPTLIMGVPDNRSSGHNALTIACRGRMKWVEFFGHCPKLGRLNRPDWTTLKMFDYRREIPRFAALLHITGSGFLEEPYGFLAIGMTFPEARFVLGFEFFGDFLVASLKAFSYALSTDCSNGVPNSVSFGDFES